MARLIDYFPDWKAHGVFTRLSDWTPWDGETWVNKPALDVAYLGNRSGWKYPSPMLMKSLPPYHVISDELFSDIDGILKMLYGEKWWRIWDAMHIEYDIGENVKYTEHTVSDGTKNIDDAGTAATDITNESTNSNYVVPFGAANGTYAETSKQAVDGETSSSAANNKTTRDTDETHEDEITKEVYGKNTATSYSEEILKELELRKNAFFEIVFADVDEVLTSPYWE